MAADPHTLRHPLLRCAEQVHAAVDAAMDSDPGYLRVEDKRAALAVLAAARERVRALEVRLLASADDVAVATGARNVAAWAAAELRADYGQVVRGTRLGAALDRRWPVLGRAFLEGQVSETQAGVIVAALDALPDEVGPEVKARAEAHLVEQAADFGPRALRKLGERVLEVLAPDIAEEVEHRRLRAAERAARRDTRLTMHARGDGSTDLRIRIPQAAAQRLKVYLEAVTAPRRHNGEPVPDAEAGEVGRLPYARRLGEGFVALLERMPAQVLPQHGGTATAVMVMIPFDQLKADLSSAGVAQSGTGDTITAGEARRLACTAGIIPVVLGGRSEILDLGRTRRLFSGPQRKAMAIRDRRCRTEGCDIPAAWCEAHHAELPWARGGRTDLEHGVSLCSWHHHRAHDPRYRADRLSNGDYRFTRRT